MRLILAIVAGIAAAACNPFGDMAIDKEFVVPDDEIANVELIVPERRLPPSARNVRMRVLHFQDTTLRVRFEAEEAEARAFAERLVGGPLSTECGAMTGHERWWISPEELERAECGEASSADGDGLPAVKIALIRSGDRATVWLHTFTT